MDAKPIVRTPEEVAAVIKIYEAEEAHCDQCSYCYGKPHHSASIVAIDVLKWVQGEDNDFGKAVKSHLKDQQHHHEQTITE